MSNLKKLKAQREQLQQQIKEAEQEEQRKAGKTYPCRKCKKEVFRGCITFAHDTVGLCFDCYNRGEQEYIVKRISGAKIIGVTFEHMGTSVRSILIKTKDKELFSIVPFGFEDELELDITEVEEDEN